jgi:hypothetical protein
MMKHILRYGFILYLAFVLAGCASGAQTNPTTATSTPAANPMLGDEPGSLGVVPTLASIGAEQARTVLADVYRVSPDEIEVVAVERTIFSDDCLDTGVEGEVCTKEDTPGYIVTLEVNGSSHILHTTQSGNVVRIVSVKPVAE